MQYIDNYDCIIASDFKKSRPYAKVGLIIKLNGEPYEITKIDGHDIYVKKVY